MKTFKQFLESNDYDERSWSDPAEWLPAYHDDWCKENPTHKDCEEWRKKQKKKEGKK
jgi:hypothetical protein